MFKKLVLILFSVLLLQGISFAYDEAWDFSAPDGSVNANTLDTVITDFKKAVAERLNNDHFFDEDNALADNLTVCTHRKVTMYNTTTVSAGATNTGILHVKDNASKAELFYMDEDSNDVQITKAGKLALAGTNIDAANLTLSGVLSVGGNSIVNGNSTVNGNSQVDGTIDITGNASLSGAVTLTGHLYSFGGQLGSWATGYSADTAYLAARDTLVCSYETPGSTSDEVSIVGKTDSANPPTTAVTGDRVRHAGGSGTYYAGITFICKKGHYWFIDETEHAGSGTTTIYTIMFD